MHVLHLDQKLGLTDFFQEGYEVTTCGDDLAHFTFTICLGHHEVCLCPDNIHKPEIHCPLELIIASVGHYGITAKTCVKRP